MKWALGLYTVHNVGVGESCMSLLPASWGFMLVWQFGIAVLGTLVVPFSHMGVS